MEAIKSQEPLTELRDKTILRGTLEIWDRKKGEKDFHLTQRTHNLVVTAGKNLARDRLFSNSSSYIRYGGVGTGTTAPTVSDTALETPLGDREAFIEVDLDSDGQSTVEWYYDFDEANGDHSEAGLFTALTSGTMLCRATFTASTKDATIQRLYRWIFEFAGD